MAIKQGWIREWLPVSIFTILVVSYILIAGTKDIGLAISHIILMAVCFMQNVSFVLVSRSRNRNNPYYHLATAISSNGIWFIVFAQLVPKDLSTDLLIPFIGGTTLGSLFGASVAIKVEGFFKLTAGATEVTGDIQKRSIWNILMHYSPFMLLGIMGIFSISLTNTPMLAIMVTGLAYIQNTIFGMSSRAKNRNGKMYMLLTAVASGLISLLMLKILFARDMPMELLIPYVIGTVFGSLSGARISISIERVLGLVPDGHVGEKKQQGVSAYSLWGYRVLLSTLLVLSTYQFTQSSDTVIFLLVAILFLAQNVTYALASRASNRNIMNYHLIFRIISGLVWFLLYKELLVLLRSASYFEAAVPAIVGMTLGSLFGWTIGQKIEAKIGAVMDIGKEGNITKPTKI